MYRVSLVKLGGVGSLIVVTGSMEPTINPDEMIIIKEQKSYKENDIITYRDKFGQLITHRIVEIDGENIVTKGDSNNEPDEIISIDKIEGKVIIHSVVLGFIFLHVLKPLLIIVILGYVFSVLKYIFVAKIFLKLC
jgi:signal peptidase